MNIFKYLTLPELELKLHEPTYWKGQPDFILLLSRPACSLEKLSFESESRCLSKVDLVQCLKATPTLTHLQIWNAATMTITRKVLAHMTHRGLNNRQSDCLVPKLVNLQVHPYRKPYKDQAFSEMIQSRWRDDELEGVRDGCPERLSTVTIVLDDIAEEKSMTLTLGVLRELKTKGMEVSVKGSKGICWL
jgi:hypothetical protein